MDIRPDTNPKSVYGILKPPMSLIPRPAMIEEAVVFGLGAKKYGPYNWRETSVSARVYLDAIERHIASWIDGESDDPESGASHLAHARACLGIILDAQACGMLIDDRPKPGASAAAIKRHTKQPAIEAPAETLIEDEGGAVIGSVVVQPPLMARRYMARPDEVRPLPPLERPMAPPVDRFRDFLESGAPERCHLFVSEFLGDDARPMILTWPDLRDWCGKNGWRVEPGSRADVLWQNYSYWLRDNRPPA